MKTVQRHPSSAHLLAFLHGRLSDGEFGEVEEHLASCDDCCRWMAHQPDNTLLALAREATTLGFHEQRPAEATPLGEIPSALRDHPRYRVIQQIGVGGMGSVYSAEHRLMQRLVALKIIHPWLLSNSQAVERFQREVRLAARLTHPNIVASHDADQVASLHFLVMEHVAGETLQQRILRLGPASVAQVCDWICQVARGLQHAHEQGMAHRDIKPHNLMLSNDNQMKILDFGLSRLVAERVVDARDSNSELCPSSATHSNMILGTPDYIAPEQISNSRAADVRSDIYSLGCTLYFLLTGRPPFDGQSVVSRLQAHESMPFPSIQQARPDAPPRLAEILARMTAKRPEDRYPTPGEVAADLGALFAPLESPLLIELPLPVAEPSKNHSVHLAVAPTTQPPPVGLLNTSRGVVGVVVVLLALSGIGYLLSGLISPPPARRMLVMLPSKGLWYPDYKELVDAAKNANTELIFVGVSEHPSELLHTSPQGVALADVQLGPDVHAKDYQAIIFIGYETREFQPGGVAGEETKRLLSDFQRQRKVVASLCTGQRILAQQGALRGKKVSPCAEVRPDEITVAGGERTTQSVQADAGLVTASEAKDAPLLLQAILKSARR